MNKVEIINKLLNQGNINNEEAKVLLNNDERLKHFYIWKSWKYDETILLNSELVENLKKTH